MLFRLIEQLFPTRSDYLLMRDAALDELLHLSLPTINGEITYLLPFAEPKVRAAIHEAKFHQNEKAWSMLATVLIGYLKHREKDVMILPIPLSNKRRRERKYNQVEEVIRKVKKLDANINARSDILFRTRDTKPQTSLTKKERLVNMVGAFGAHQVDSITGQHLIILDDVTTTGATLKQARATLAPHHPASITLLALAH